MTSHFADIRTDRFPCYHCFGQFLHIVRGRRKLIRVGYIVIRAVNEGTIGFLYHVTCAHYAVIQSGIVFCTAHIDILHPDDNGSGTFHSALICSVRNQAGRFADNDAAGTCRMGIKSKCHSTTCGGRRIGTNSNGTDLCRTFVIIIDRRLAPAFYGHEMNPAACTSCNGFQLCYIDGIGIFRAGCHAGNLACNGAAISDRYGSMCGFPCSCRISRCRLGCRIIACYAFIDGGHRRAAESHTTIFGRISFCAQNDRITDSSGGSCGRGAEDKCILCIGNSTVRTDYGHAAYIRTCIIVAVNHIINRLLCISSCQGIFHANYLGTLCIIRLITTADGEYSSA